MAVTSNSENEVEMKIVKGKDKRITIFLKVLKSLFEKQLKGSCNKREIMKESRKVNGIYNLAKFLKLSNTAHLEYSLNKI